MVLPRTYIHKRSSRGFTLIEILVVMGLFVILAGFGLFVSMDSFRGYMFRNERDVVISLLQKARSQAINNMCFGGGCTGGKAHGVHFGPGQYVVFQGLSYVSRDSAVDEVTPVENNASSVVGSDVIFSPLAATTSSATVTVSGTDGHTSIISIATEGQITWTH